GGTRVRSAAEGDEGGRDLHGRSGQGPGRHADRPDHRGRSSVAEPAGHGHDRPDDVPGEPDSGGGVRLREARRNRAGRAGGRDRDEGGSGVTVKAERSKFKAEGRRASQIRSPPVNLDSEVFSDFRSTSAPAIPPRHTPPTSTQGPS